MDLLKKLTAIYAPSGHEGAMREFLKTYLSPYVDEISTDVLGNLICHKKGNGKKIMLAAHMDEIGVIVTNVCENGFLRFAPVGGVHAANCINRAVVFENGVRGVISHENKEKPDCPLGKMYIDIGTQEGIEIGDCAVFEGEYFDMGNRVAAKALDDRAGCCALVSALAEAERTQNDIYAVFTSQEELGLRGAKCAAASIEPDMGIAVDVSFDESTPESAHYSLSLGKGAGIKLCDASFIMPMSVRDFLVSCAKGAGTDFQFEAAQYGGTDSGAISLSASGVPSGTISIPTRYIHSPREVCDKRDIKSAAQIIRAVIETKL
ncbi:MAG: M20/M25/M40 family metallo-hydrolase [Clostridia bacterium]|nr:M20/M25/M40 family metallo-hydrolase [Clostridia bacterium]